VQFSVTLFAALLLAVAAERWRRSLQAAAVAATFLLALYLGNPSYDDGRVAGELRHALGPAERAVIAAHPESPLSATLPLLFRVRTVASVELSLPYHLGFYRPAAQRIRDAFAAWYSDDPAKAWSFQRKYGVTHWVLEGAAWAGRDAGFALHKPWRDEVPRRMAEIPKPVLARIYEGRAQDGRPVVVPAGEMDELLKLWPRPQPHLQVPALKIQH
jgi:hypothetical protein